MTNLSGSTTTFNYGEPSRDKVGHAVTSALIDILLTVPSLPWDLIPPLRELQRPHTTLLRAMQLAEEISDTCKIAQQAQGRL